MKRKMFLLGIVLLIVLFAGILIYLKNTEPAVVHTYKENLSEEQESSDELIWMTYYQMSDGTWKTETHTYQYRLVLSGKMGNGTATYTVLSNRENITYQEAMMASGLSSNLDDYFDAEEAVIVSMGIRMDSNED